jgi:hypothetical protein
MSIGFIQIILLTVLIVVWFGFYALGNFLCNKSRYLRKNINKNSIIILSLIYFPLVMAITNEGYFFALGWCFIGPISVNSLIHWLYPKIFKPTKTSKIKVYFNENYFYGYFGILILGLLSLFTYS